MEYNYIFDGKFFPRKLPRKLKKATSSFVEKTLSQSKVGVYPADANNTVDLDIDEF